jgi:NADP-dependent 3-hydroxy acid dehydrogenase YdfG
MRPRGCFPPRAPGARRVDRLKSLADELTRRGGKALAIETDVTDDESSQRMVNR